MQRDFKVGLLVGACALLGVLIWLASRESLSPEARLEKHFQQARSQAKASRPAPDGTQVPRAQAPRAQAPGAQTAKPSGPVIGPNVSMPLTAKHEAETKPVTVDAGLGPQEHANELGPVDLAAPKTRPKIKTQHFHIVRQGETLSEISQQYYGTVRHVNTIKAANQDLIKDADLIQPGMRLVIPDLNPAP